VIAALAAAANSSDPGSPPSKTSSAVRARHGIVPTPPSPHPRLLDDAILHDQCGRHGDQRELVRRAVSDLQVTRPRDGWQQRDLDGSDQLAVDEPVVSDLDAETAVFDPALHARRGGAGVFGHVRQCLRDDEVCAGLGRAGKRSTDTSTVTAILSREHLSSLRS
jgi:hypothetical protein